MAISRKLLVALACSLVLFGVLTTSPSHALDKKLTALRGDVTGVKLHAAMAGHILATGELEAHDHLAGGGGHDLARLPARPPRGSAAYDHRVHWYSSPSQVMAYKHGYRNHSRRITTES